MKTVSVVGATGRQGLAQIKCLLESGYEVRALSRSDKPLAEPYTNTVQVQQMDLMDESSLQPALAGSDYVFYNQPLHMNEHRVELIEMMGRACKAAKVERLVWNTSSWIPNRPGDPATYILNTMGINRLWATGMSATVFGSVLFMDNLLTDWARPSLMNDHRYIYPHAPHVEANWISLDDVGKIMVASLDRPDMAGTWMNIGGPERLTGAQVAATLAEVLGFEIEYAPYTPEEFAAALTSALSDSVPDQAKKEFEDYISTFYHYNNTAPTKPFAVNAQYLQECLPEVQLETLKDWAARQDWSDSANRPSGG